MNTNNAVEKEQGSKSTVWWFAAALAVVLGAIFYFQNARREASGERLELKDQGVLPASMGQKWREIDNPAQDGWDTEVLSSKIEKVLKVLAHQATHPEGLEEEFAGIAVSDQFVCNELLPSSRKTVFQDAALHIERQSSSQPEAFSSAVHHGKAGLRQAFVNWLTPMQQAKQLHSKFKLFRILPEGNQVTTLQYVAVSGQVAGGMIEQNATWTMRWILGGDETPGLESIAVSDCELVTSKLPSEGLLADCTASVMKSTDCYEKQFLRGMNHWYERIQDRRYYYLLSQPGLAVGDVNGDGLEDLYVCQDEGLPNRLLIQQPDGTILEKAEEWGVNWLHSSRGALLVDLDNDGKSDLVVAMVGHVIIAQNMGNRFEIRQILPTDDDTMSLAAADYNRDGKLDVFVCVYHANSRQRGARGDILGGIALAGDGRGGGRNALFRNDIQGGKWAFTDVTKETGIDLDNDRYSFGACWEDYDQDGWIDLYVANDYGRNQLFRNVEGRFLEVARAAGAEDKAFSMSASWGDYNQDGWMDLYVGNMFSGAGGRITFQEKFLKNKPELKHLTQRFTRGNTLFKNLGNGRFEDVSEASSTTMGRWAWSSNFVDLNCDGLEDLLVANGYLTTEDTGDL